MKKLIKRILKSRCERDEDFKDKNTVLSKRSYKYFQHIGEKLFKKFLSTSISIRLNKNEELGINKKETIVDQEDLLGSMSLLVPYGRFLEYCSFSAAAGEDYKTRSNRKRRLAINLKNKRKKVAKKKAAKKKAIKIGKKEESDQDSEESEEEDKDKESEEEDKDKECEEDIENDKEKEDSDKQKNNSMEKEIINEDDEFSEDDEEIEREFKSKDKRKKASTTIPVKPTKRITTKVVPKLRASTAAIISTTKSKSSTTTTSTKKTKSKKAAITVPKKNNKRKRKEVEEEAESEVDTDAEVDEEATEQENTQNKDSIISESFIRKKIKEQSYKGNYKYTKCFIRSFCATLNYIFNELIDCCLIHIFKISRRKNVIDLIDLLKTISKDEDLRMLINKIINGTFEDNSQTGEFLKEVCKGLKGDSKTFNKEVIYNSLQTNFKKLESNRNKKPISSNSKLTEDKKSIEKTKYTLSNNKVITRVSMKYIKPIYNSNQDTDETEEDDIEFTQEYFSTLKQEELKEICKPIGVKVGGNKSQIIQRLLEYYSGTTETLSKTVTLITQKLSKKKEISFHPFMQPVRVEILKETKQIIQPAKYSIYFEIDNLDTQDNEDEDDDLSFIDGDYSNDEESEIEGNDAKELYQYDYNKYKQDQLDSLFSTTTTITSSENRLPLHEKLSKKSARWVWKNKLKLNLNNNIESYKLPDESDDDYDDDDDQNNGDQDDKVLEKDNQVDESYGEDIETSEVEVKEVDDEDDEDDESISDSAELDSYESGNEEETV